MSEVVVRMEMPKNCLKCPLRNQCEIFRDWFGRFGTSTTRRPYPKPFDKGCRIICQLPEGHGRLVNADHLLRDIEEYHVSDGWFQHWLELQPTIVPATEGGNHEAD